jgi:predicted amino acid dehydrogenase
VLSVVAGRGKELQARCGIPVTTGNAATAWAAAVVARGVAGQRRVAVLGARGAVGRALVELLGAEADPPDLGEYEVVVGAHTSGGVLDPGALRPGTTLVDVALPPTLSAAPRPGTTVLAGESVRLPRAWRRDGWAYIFHLAAGYGLSHVYACLLEPYLALRTGRGEPFAQGRALALDAVHSLAAAAEAEGFRPEPRRLRVAHALVKA